MIKYYVKINNERSTITFSNIISIPSRFQRSRHLFFVAIVLPKFLSAKQMRPVKRAMYTLFPRRAYFWNFLYLRLFKPSRLGCSCCDSNNNRPVPVVNPSPSNFKHARRSCECKPRSASNHEMPLRVLAVKRGFNLKSRIHTVLSPSKLWRRNFSDFHLDGSFKRTVIITFRRISFLRIIISNINN